MNKLERNYMWWRVLIRLPSVIILYQVFNILIIKKIQRKKSSFPRFLRQMLTRMVFRSENEKLNF